MAAVIEASGLGKHTGGPGRCATARWPSPRAASSGSSAPTARARPPCCSWPPGCSRRPAAPSASSASRPAARPAQLARVGFVAQDTPVYARMTVADHLRLGAWLNPGWDDEPGTAPDRAARPGPEAAGRVAVRRAARPARAHPGAWPNAPGCSSSTSRSPAWTRSPGGSSSACLMEAVAEHGTSVVLSSHLVADLERVCDYLVVLVASRVRIAGEVSALLAAHHRLSGPRRDPGTLPAGQDVIEESHTDKQTILLVRTGEPVHDPAWTVTPVSLEDLVIAYMNPASEIPARRPQLGVVS